MSITNNFGIKAGIVSISLVATVFSSKADEPNILFILADDLGYGDLSVQGADDLNTPNIDKIFHNGVKLNNFYANCPVSSPSRASLLTGMYPDKVGVPGVVRQYRSGNFGYLDNDAVMLSTLLKKQEYYTAIIGKWHLGLESPNLPNDRGFDEFKGFLGDMMDDYWTHMRFGKNWMRHNKKEINPEGHATDIFSDWAIEYLEEYAEQKNPFFLYLAYNAPHDPVQPPEEWLKKVNKREPGLSDKRAKMVAFIEHLDFGVGRVLKKLEALGLDKNTIVVFTSDNGGSEYYGADNGPLRGEKQNMFEGGIKVPAAVQWKGKIKAGSESNEVIMLMDFFPTLCNAAGVEIDYEIDGVNAMDALKDNAEINDDRYLLWVRREGFKYGGQAYYAARYKNYKILQNTPFEPYQFFNMENDWKEQNPLDSLEHKMYKRLKGKLRNHIQEAGSVPWQKGK